MIFSKTIRIYSFTFISNNQIIVVLVLSRTPSTMFYLVVLHCDQGILFAMLDDSSILLFAPKVVSVELFFDILGTLFSLQTFEFPFIIVFFLSRRSYET